MEASDEQPGTDHEVKFRLLKPNGEIQTELVTGYRLPKSDGSIPVSLNFVSGFSGLAFTEAGVHEFVALNDDVELGRTPLNIMVLDSGDQKVDVELG